MNVRVISVLCLGLGHAWFNSDALSVSKRIYNASFEPGEVVVSENVWLTIDNVGAGNDVTCGADESLQNKLNAVYERSYYNFANLLLRQHSELQTSTLPAGLPVDVENFTKFWLAINKVLYAPLSKNTLDNDILNFIETFTIPRDKAIRCIWAMSVPDEIAFSVAQTMALKNDFTFVALIGAGVPYLTGLVRVVMSNEAVFSSMLDKYNDSPPSELLKVLPRMRFDEHVVKVAAERQCFKVAVMCLNSENIDAAPLIFREHLPHLSENKDASEGASGDSSCALGLIDLEMQPLLKSDPSSINGFAEKLVRVLRTLPPDVLQAQDAVNIGHLVLENFGGRLDDVTLLCAPKSDERLQLLVRLMDAGVLTLMAREGMPERCDVGMQAALVMFRSQLVAAGGGTAEDLALVAARMAELRKVGVVNDAYDVVVEVLHKYAEDNALAAFLVEHEWRAAVARAETPAAAAADARFVSLVHAVVPSACDAHVASVCAATYADDHGLERCMCAGLLAVRARIAALDDRVAAADVREARLGERERIFMLQLRCMQLAMLVGMIVAIFLKSIFGVTLLVLFYLLEIVASQYDRESPVHRLGLYRRALVMA